ncbi:DUF4440 domain-containing protein [Aestuariivivens sp. NBU2969]|uniref:YybH family protein n=1 Tax=Aestuariivivens sp. NBU2969 TaxID=2873267 RepID=UPI001CBD6F1F|nr:DUF4440 domain-containing protein [Aestuariivivens sp. NBU2969]
MRALFLLICLMGYLSGNTQNSKHDVKAIKTVLEKQIMAWNNNNMEEFMESYWKSDSLKFYSPNGITLGWKNTLIRYKKGYPSKAHTGTLSFKINSISSIEDKSYFVLGEFFLKREVGDANGIFMIILKKIDGEWKIIADTSC